ncbi:MAG: hypothetical protein ABI315_06985 [Bacteroidia bacterium]
MKKVFYISLVGFILFSSFSIIQSEGLIDKTKLTADCKAKMEPYKYDSQKFTKINFNENSQLLEIEVPVFIGEKYRIVFNTNALTTNKININVYTKSKSSSKRETIFTTNGDNSNTGEFVFDVPRVRKLFIDYEVPADASANKISGYILMMVGYK